MEFVALANHRKAIRAEIARYAERFREEQAAGLATALQRSGLELGTVSPMVISVLLTSVSVIVAMERALGMSVGHRETMELVERYLSQLEPAPSRAAGSPG